MTKVRYSVVALHPLADTDGRTYTSAQLEAYGDTLSYKPLSINHGGLPEYYNDRHSTTLDYPDFRCLSFAYSHTLTALVGKIELVKNSGPDAAIQNGDIRYVSCENYRHGESLEFRALTLLRERTPRDKAAVIIPESREVIA